MSKWWDKFNEHKAAIRTQVAQYIGRGAIDGGPWGANVDGRGTGRGKDEVGEIKVETEYTIDDFDKAEAAHDRLKLMSIMNSAWCRAPDNRAVYREDGFWQLCNLLDGTWDDAEDNAELERMMAETKDEE